MLIDKPVGWTSHDVVAVVRRRLGVRSVGHAGTLDPFATGLLVVLTGRATRLVRFVEATAKHYDATVRLGQRTDTDDATGAVVEEHTPDTWPDQGEMLAALADLTGSRMQRPPAYSAKHVAGTRSHHLARAGVMVELPPVEVAVHTLECVAWQPPELRLKAVVGKGTYLRALARDLGERLGIPAHCSELRRTAVGPFDVSEAIAPSEVSPEVLRSPAAMLPHLAHVTLDEAAVREVSFGRVVPRDGDPSGPVALLGEDGRLVAVAEESAAGWQPVVVLEPAD